MRFLNKNVKEPTKSILKIGVQAAMNDVYWDEESFARRGGEYEWQKEGKKGVRRWIFRFVRRGWVVEG